MPEPVRQYTIGAQPVPVLEFPIEDGFMLRNISTSVTIYIDTNGGARAGVGFPLGPQSTKILNPGDTCWAVCSLGQSAVLNMSPHSGNFFDPAAIASQINVTGIPAIDVFTNIISSFAVSDGTLHDLAIGDISRYQSLRIQIRAEDATGPFASPPGVGVAEIRQWSAGFSDLISVDRCSFLGTNNRGTYFNQYLQIPCKGSALSLNLSYPGIGTHIVYQVYGSYRSYVDRLSGLMTNGYWGQSGTGTYFGGNGEDGYQEWIVPAGAIIAGGNVVDYPNFHPGPGILTWDVTGNAANTIDVLVEDVISAHVYLGARNADVTSPAGAGNAVQSVILPARCLDIRIRNRAGVANAANCRVSLISNLQ